jgi:hypothetical protein
LISIGAQAGGPQDGNIAELKVDLYRLFGKHCDESYCPAIDNFALVLRINGSIDSFGLESIECLRRSRKKRYITIDIVISEERWKTLETLELKKYLAAQIRESLVVCAARLRKDGEKINEDQLLADVDCAISEFLTMDHPPNPHRSMYCPKCGVALRSALAKQCLECGTDWH